MSTPRAPLSVALAVLTVTGLASGLAGCGSIDQGSRRIASAVTPYKSEVVQGNFVSSEQVAQLHAGMTRLQVRDLLGTPLITPLFVSDRWDYVFTMNRKGVPQQRYRLTLYFAGDTLDHFDGDTMPSEDEFVQRISGHSRKEKVPPLTATAAQLHAFTVANTPAARASASNTASAAVSDKTYPPLE